MDSFVPCMVPHGHEPNAVRTAAVLRLWARRLDQCHEESSWGWRLRRAATSLDKTEELLALTLQEFRRLKDEPVPDDELRRAKDQLKGSLMLSLESTGSRMANLARQHMYFGRFFELDEILDAIDRVPAAAIQQASLASVSF